MKAFVTRTELLPHQVAAVEKIKPTRVGALFMDMGTGKSRTAIEITKDRAAKIDRVIWFCPVSLKETVRQEILKHTDCEPGNICVFDDRTSEQNVPRAIRWYVVGIESMSSSARIVATVNKLVTDRSMVICDESSYIKGHNAIRTRRITHIASRARYRLALTGTPLSQGVVDLFAQMNFLSPKILGYRSFYSFAANHLEYSEKYPGMIVRAHNLGYLAAKIQPYTYQVTKDECLELPDKIYTTRYFSMTLEQRDWYETAKNVILAEFIDDMDNIAIYRLFSALQQIVSGYWNWRQGFDREQRCYDPGPKVFRRIEFEHQRIDTLLSTIDEIPPDEKIIIWCKFHHDINQITQALKNEFGSGATALFHGGLSERERNNQVEFFRRSARFFLATQSSGGHGLTLNEARYVIFYNNGFKYSDRLQAEDRCHRIGQISKVTYIDIRCVSSIDKRISDALARKSNAVHTFRTEVDLVKGKKAKLKELIKAL